MKDYLYTFVAWNIIAFMMMAVDKTKAKHSLWRISESLLIAFAFLYGALGIGLGMLVFHHKTRKWKFRILVPIALLMNVITGYLWFVR